MKKFLLTVSTLVLVVFGLVACNNNSNGNGNGNGNNNGDEEKYDLGGIDFVIRANTANRADPRNEEYERMYRNEKIANIEMVEEKYNVKVKYLNYPGNASWGVQRDNWIIEQAKLGTTDSHVFEVSSNSVANLANQGAISALDEYIEEFGNEGYWAKKRSFGTILGKTYAYDDVFSVAEEGIFYNSDLLGALLGEENRIQPTEMWENGEWTWEAFAELADVLNERLDHTRPAEEGGPQYVLGGRTYDWFYPMVGSNGGSIVDSNFESHLLKEEVLETLSYLNSLREIDGMWIDDAVLSNTTQPEFRAGNVVFHAGADWFLTIDSRWGGLDFNVDYVPFPVGPKAQEDMTLYSQSKVKSEPAFVISSAFSKENIPEGYEDMYLHDELIFKIWNDIIHFPPIDESTGEASIEDMKDNYYSTRLLPNYASEKSREAHLDVWALAKVDHFYSVVESQNQTEGSYMLQIEDAIRNGDIRQKMESLHNELQGILDDRFK